MFAVFNGLPQAPTSSSATPTSSTAPRLADSDSNATNNGHLFHGFVENHGQWRTDARFVGRLGAMIVRAEPGEIVLQSATDEPAARQHVVRFLFEGSSQVAPSGCQRLPGAFNFLLGDDPAKWQRHVPSFAAVEYAELYPGVDMRLYERDGLFEYDLDLAPTADPADVLVRCEGIDKLSLDDDGSLRMATAAGPLVQRPPVAWLVSTKGDSERTTCVFRIVDERHFTFDVPDRQAGAAVLIDPGLTWSTFLGGSGQDRAIAVAATQAGEPLVLGRTSSPNFPVTAGAFDTDLDSYDMTLTCFDPSGGALVFSTFLGGSDLELPFALALGPDGRIGVGGWTRSTDFPTLASSWDTKFAGGNYDACVAVLNETGDDLLFSTLIGGTCAEEVRGIGFSSSGDIVVAGESCSADFPVTPAAFDTTYGGAWDGFLATFDPSIAGPGQLVGCTFLGTTGQDFIVGLVMDEDDHPVVAGTSTAADFPTTPGAFDTSPGQAGLSGFVTRVSLDTSTVLTSTHLKTGTPRALALGGSDVVVAANVSVLGFPTTPGAFDSTPNGLRDALLVKLDGQLSQLLAATCLGGANNDDPYAVTVDWTGSIVVAGATGSLAYPTTPGAFDTVHGGIGGDTVAMVSRLSGDLTKLEYSTFLGGVSPTSNFARGVAMIAPADAVVVGEGAVTGFPVTPGAFDTTFNGGDLGGADGFVLRLPLDPVWTALSGAIAGSNGTPVLAGSGDLTPGELVTIALHKAKPTTNSTLLIGLSLLAQPLKGGVLIPSPDVMLPGVLTAPDGSLSLAATWPAGVPSGLSFYLQAWMPDSAAPAGLSASNGLSAVVP